MENKDVPFLIYESSLARMERQTKRLFILCIVIFAAFVLSNLAWIIYENQFVDSVTEQIETSAEDGGNAYGTIISNNKGDVTYGESEDNKN